MYSSSVTIYLDLMSRWIRQDLIKKIRYCLLVRKIMLIVVFLVANPPDIGNDIYFRYWKVANRQWYKWSICPSLLSLYICTIYESGGSEQSEDWLHRFVSSYQVSSNETDDLRTHLHTIPSFSPLLGRSLQLYVLQSICIIYNSPDHTSSISPPSPTYIYHYENKL